MKTLTALSILSLTSVGLITACGSDDSGDTTPTTTTTPATTTTAPTPSGDAFYTPPSPLPKGAAGDIIWMSKFEDTDTTNGYKVLYLSKNVKDDPIAVSGLIWVPDNVANDSPVLTYAHGTTGLGDQCAPSKSNGAGEAADIAKDFTRDGFIVAATDYEGLGTPGVHPYVVGDSEGRGVLDIILAARNLTDTSGESIIWGHSQGGGAALFAAELAPTYAPNANVVGAVAGAPAVELKLLTVALAKSPYFGYLFMASAGFKAAYPDLDLSQLLTAEGIAAVESARTGCTEINDVVRGKDPAIYIAKDLASTEPLATYLEENTPGNRTTDVPIFVYHGEADKTIPVVGSKLYLDRACRTGGFSILRKTYPDVGHVDVIQAARSDITSWIDARLAGATAETTPCS